MSNRFRPFVVGVLCCAFFSMASAVAWADDEILLDLVRHGETLNNLNGIIDTAPPGADLDATGRAEATTVAGTIYDDYGKDIAGIYASEEARTVETATYLANLFTPQSSVDVLPGLNEIPAGVFEGDPTTSLEGVLYLLGPLSWVFGDVLMPDIGDPSVNGVTFDESFGGAVQDIYQETASATGTAHDVAFSSEGAIAVWTLMNVNNPDFSALFQTFEATGQFLPNTGQVVVDGSPGDWTLVSYNGISVPADPGLGTELFVDFRNLIEAPQFAGYDVYEALLTGDSATIDAAVQSGLTQVDTAFSQFPTEVFDQIVAAFGGSV